MLTENKVGLIAHILYKQPKKTTWLNLKKVNLLNNHSASKNIFRQSTSWKIFFQGFLRSDLQCKKNTFRTSEKKNKLENTTKSIFCSKDL